MSNRAVYTMGEINSDAFRLNVKIARQRWKDRCAQYMSTNGDMGSCVLGAGISIYYLPSNRHRKPQHLMLIPAISITGAQGSLVWEHSVAEIIEFLQSQDIDAFYDPGRMD